MDPGLQPQRTALAWGRTGLAFFVNAFLVLRMGEQSGKALTIGLGVFLLAVATGTIGIGLWRSRTLVQTPAPAGPPADLLLAIVVVVWIACIAGVTSILTAAAST